MSLDAAALSTALRNALESAPASASAAASALAAAYHTYATAGRFGTSIPTLPTAKRDAMAATLTAALVPASGSPASFANAWASALTVYWTGVAVTGTQTGTTTPPTGGAALIASLTALFASYPATASACASGLSSALDTCTKTTIATVTPPAGTILPLL